MLFRALKRHIAFVAVLTVLIDVTAYFVPDADIGLAIFYYTVLYFILIVGAGCHIVAMGFGSATVASFAGPVLVFTSTVLGALGALFRPETLEHIFEVLPPEKRFMAVLPIALGFTLPFLVQFPISMAFAAIGARTTKPPTGLPSAF